MTNKELWRPLTAVYDEREAQAVARMVLEVHFGLTMAEVLCGQMPDECELRQIQQRLLAGEPVQYVIGEAEFGGRRFRVAPGVLIPRPETYELCQWVIEERGDIEIRGARYEERLRVGEQSSGMREMSPRGERILDIGTGSGCIACTLAAELPEAEVTAWDISEDALAIARENAKRTHVHVSFELVDVLQSPPISRYDLIVSNPPYICQQEAEAMEHHVLDHEPRLALFVPDDDPLLFYRAIAQYGSHALTPGGSLFFEINPLYASELETLLSAMSYHDIEIRNDQFGKPRMIKATR